MKTKGGFSHGQFIKSKGIAISIDALLAMILTIAFIGFIGIGMQGTEEPATKATEQLSQAAADVFTALDKSGLMATRLADRELSGDALNCEESECGLGLYNAAEKMLPENTGLKIVVNEYRAENLDTCRDAYADYQGSRLIYDTIEEVFDACFKSKAGEAGKPYATAKYPPENLPEDEEVIHGRKSIILRQKFGGEAAEGKCYVPPQTNEIEAKEAEVLKEAVKALLQPLQPDIEREVEAGSLNPDGSIHCDSTPDFTIKTRNKKREPLAIMLALDKSGSMGVYDMPKCVTPQQSNSCADPAGCPPGQLCNASCIAAGCTCCAETEGCPDGQCSKMQTGVDGGICLTGGLPAPCTKGRNCCPGSTGWTTIGSFTISSEISTAVQNQPNGRYYATAFFGSIHDYGGGCNNGMRINIVRGATTFPGLGYYGYSPTRFYGQASIPSASLTAADYTIKAWSDVTEKVEAVPPYPQMYEHFNNGGKPLGGTPINVSGGTGECGIASGGWATVGTFTLGGEQLGAFLAGSAYNPVLLQMWGQIKYSDYDTGGCGNLAPRVRLTRNGNPIANFSGCTGGTCTTHWTSEGWGTWAAGDTFAIEAWSDEKADDPTKINEVSYYFYAQRNTTVTQENVPAGKCYDTSDPFCPASGAEGACSTLKSNCGTTTNWKGIAEFEVEAEKYKSLRLYYTYSGYAGACSGDSPLLMVKKPNGTLASCGTSSCFFQSSGAKIIQGDEGQLLDASSPESPWTISAWSDELTTMNLDLSATRMDVSKYSAKQFVENSSWKTEDRLGLVSYSSAATVEQTLIGPTDPANMQKVIDGIYSLEPAGETAIASAITEAALGVKDFEYDGKFIILLTDGQANICSGGAPCDYAAAIADAKTAADAARAAGITIFVIGFADESLMGAQYEADLKEIANDAAECTEYCGKYYYAADESALQDIYKRIALQIAGAIGLVDITLPFSTGIEPVTAGITCGVLNETTGIFTDTAACKSATSWNPGSMELLFKKRGINLGVDNWWAAEIPLSLPCDAENCDQEYIYLPPEDTDILETSATEPIYWDDDKDNVKVCEEDDETCHEKIKFKYKDLDIGFTEGTINTVSGSTTGITLDFDINNNGYLDITIRAPDNDLQIAFYKCAAEPCESAIVPGNRITVTSLPLSVEYFDADSPLGEGVTPMGARVDEFGYLYIYKGVGESIDLCPWKEALANGNPLACPSYRNIRVRGLTLNNSSCPGGDCTGTIVATINENRNVNECPLHYMADIVCSAEPQFRLYTIDYYVWRK